MKRIAASRFVLLVLATFAFSGCGDDDGATPDASQGDAARPADGSVVDGPPSTPDASEPGIDGAEPDATDHVDGSVDAPSSVDASVDASSDVDASSSIDANSLVTAGDTCATTTAIGARSTILSTTVGLENDYTGFCAGDGADGVFSLVVPAGQVLRVLATPLASDFDLALAVVTPVAACVDPLDVCAASVDAEIDGQAERIGYRNAGATDVTVNLIVDGYLDIHAGPFSLETTVGSPAAGDNCDNAVTLVSATAESNQDRIDDYQGDGVGCAVASTRGSGPDKVYAVSIPAGQTLTVSASTTVADFDMVLNLLPGPAASCSAEATCLAGKDDAGEGGTETLTYENTTGSLVEAFLVVDGFGPGDVGTYDLTVTVL